MSSFSRIAILGIISVLFSSCANIPNDSSAYSRGFGEIDGIIHLYDEAEWLEKSIDTEAWMFEETQAIPPILKLQSLKKNARKSDFEIRLWLNFGMPGDETLFLVGKDKAGIRAFVYRFERIWYEGTNPTVPKVLSGARADRPTFVSEIREILNTFQPVVPSDPYMIDRHEGLICLEVFDRGVYSSVVYGQHSAVPDALRLKSLCGFLSEEFNAQLDCHGERTRLKPIR